MRLHAIDAPEMPGACRPGRDCTPGDPYKSRDYLAGLTKGHVVECSQVDTDTYGRRVVECAADGRSLGCDMVAAGMAVERYGHLDCPGSRAAAPRPLSAVDARLADVSGTKVTRLSRAEEVDLAMPGAAPPTERTRLGSLPALASSTPSPAGYGWALFLLWLLVINAVTALAFSTDKARARARSRRLPEALLLGLTLAGGSIGAIAVQRALHHKTRKQPFANRLLMIAGVHLGIILALAASQL